MTRRVGLATGVYKDHIHPALVNRPGNPKPIQALHRPIVPLARLDIEFLTLPREHIPLERLYLSRFPKWDALLAGALPSRPRALDPASKGGCVKIGE